MSTNFPGTALDSFTRPQSTDQRSSPDHATVHDNVYDSIEALEAKVGVDSSAVQTSHDYKLSTITGANTAAPVATTVTLTGTQTLTNKTITRRVLSATSYTTDTGTSLNCDNYDMFIVTAQAGALKFNNPTGTPTDGQTLWLAVTGTAARALTYDTQFESSANGILPTTTVTTTRIDIAVAWRADTSKWHCVGVA